MRRGWRTRIRQILFFVLAFPSMKLQWEMLDEYAIGTFKPCSILPNGHGITSSKIERSFNPYMLLCGVHP